MFRENNILLHERKEGLVVNRVGSIPGSDTDVSCDLDKSLNPSVPLFPIGKMRIPTRPLSVLSTTMVSSSGQCLHNSQHNGTLIVVMASR